MDHYAGVDVSLEASSVCVAGLSHLRMSERGQELRQEGVIPTGLFELGFHRAARGFEPGKVEGECGAAGRDFRDCDLCDFGFGPRSW